MPNIIDNPDNPSQVEVVDTDIHYKYPRGLDLSPGSGLHKKIISEVTRRARESHDIMSRRYDSWKTIDKVLATFVSKVEKVSAFNKGDKTIPVIIPTSFATLETLLTYMVAAFLQDPYYRYRHVGPEDVIGTLLFERVINLQAHKMVHGLNLHTLWRDAFSYGLGAVSLSWYKHMGYRRKKVTTTLSSITGLFNTGKTKTVKRWITLYEGNRLNNIDPYFYLPDPSVAVHDVQRGEFVGWVDRTSLTDLLEMENEPGSFFFNARHMKGRDGRSTIYKNLGTSSYGIRQSPSGDTQGIPRHDRAESSHSTTNKPVDLTYMYINLIPEEWKLGKGKYPAKWMFILAGDAVVVAAQPLNLDHNMYPIAVAAPDYDGYSVSPVSRMEIGYGTQHLIDWLFDSHIANVRKIINDTLIVDPYGVNMNDFKTGRPGGIIRTRRANWGRGVQGLVEQLKVVDATRGHLVDAQILTDIHNKSTGATDAVQGIARKGGERVSATEARGTQKSALSKLEKAAKIMAMQYHGPLSYMLASQTQQLMKEDVFVEVIGEYEQELLKEHGVKTSQGNVRVSPKDMILDWDMVPHDGTIPGHESPDLWIELLRIVHESPIIAQKYDVGRIFEHTARQLGARNIQDFIKKGGQLRAEVVSDEQALEAAAQQGA